MKLYMHPVSMTSRPVRLFIADNSIDCRRAGRRPDDRASTTSRLTLPINPNRLVPVLEDGDFRLTESSAILKYLADKIGSPAYPKDLKQRAKVNEMMDWLNTNFYRDCGYGLHLSAALPAPSSGRTRRGAGGDRRLGQGAAPRGWLQILERPLDRPEQAVSLRRPDHHRRLFRRRHSSRSGELDPLRFRALSQCPALARQHEEAAELAEGQRGLLRLRATRLKGQQFDGLSASDRSSAMIKGLHHNAYRCRDSEETRRFYEDFLGLPLVNTLRDQGNQERPQTDPRAAHLLPAGRRLLPRLLRGARHARSSSRAQHDFDLHIALECRAVPQPMLGQRARRAGIETRGIADHGFIDLIYFRDPNGYVIELTAKRPDHDQAMDPATATTPASQLDALAGG